MRNRASPARRGFTLTELLTVVGLITLLVSLLLPVVSKVRAAASNTNCLSNLRQMGVAWTMYCVDNQGRLPHYMWLTPSSNASWYGYWPGILAKNGVSDELLLCPVAREETANQSTGFGNAAYAWSGRYVPVGNGSGVRLDNTTYRVSSYGYNWYLHFNQFGGTTAVRSSVTSLSQINNLANVPAFFDCAYADAKPDNGAEGVIQQIPPNLTGDGLTPGSPQAWRFLLARHGRGINVCMADGGARWVRLEDTYQLTWKASWKPYSLRLPSR
jgi:prepilin-type N-terminal cleavage/methylation domain-containing protein/prepilin-type processing-associated H-X9-DG protein